MRENAFSVYGERLGGANQASSATAIAVASDARRAIEVPQVPWWCGCISIKNLDVRTACSKGVQMV